MKEKFTYRRHVTSQLTQRLILSRSLTQRLNRIQKRNPIQQGFTLVELLIVVVILGILSGIGIPAILNQQKKAVASANNTLAMSAARACAAAVAGGQASDYEAPATKTADGSADAVSGTCEDAGTGSSFTANTDSTKATDAVADITASGSVDLTTRSEPTE